MKYLEARRRFLKDFWTTEFEAAGGCVTTMARNTGVNRTAAYLMLERVGIKPVRRDALRNSLISKRAGNASTVAQAIRKLGRREAAG